ncbi:MAG: BrnT family toxin [Acetobacteraceae bacterium]
MDEVKREKVLHERGIDFRDLAASLFDGRPVVSVPSSHEREERFITIGLVSERMFAVVWTWREEAVRFITARRARDGEERAYRALHGQ